jgi:hypothetical protein
MLPQDWPRIVSASVVPVVIISACGLLCLAFYNRLSSLVSRLRGFHRERLHEQERMDRRRRDGASAGADDNGARADCGPPHGLMLEVLEEQTAHLLRRARLIRRTLLCLLSTIASLTLCSLLSGLGVVWPPAAVAAVAVFLLGMALLLAGILFAMAELVRALDPVELETEFVAGLTGVVTHGRVELLRKTTDGSGNGDGSAD